MAESDVKELAKKHWEYTKGLLVAAGVIPSELDHYLYVQAMLHGFKHGKESRQ